MIPTFLLKKNMSENWSDNSMGLNINPLGYTCDDSIFLSLKNAIDWAISYEEDIVYCVCDEEASTAIDFEILENVIYDLVPEGIYSLYLDADYIDSINVNKHCVVLEGITKVSSFFLTKPIFQFALSILEEGSQKMKWLDFLTFISPHAFALQSHESDLSKKIKFHVISPFRNAENYLQEYLDSIQKQCCIDYTIYLIDDCSTDRSNELVKKKNNIIKITNSKRKYALKNIIDVLLSQKMKSDDVICLVDADDYLPHKYVLNILQSVYQDEKLLLTYGSLQYMNKHPRLGAPYNRKEFEDLRGSPWKGAPLRTFRYKLFQELVRQDPDLHNFRDQQGNVLRMPYDMALFFPLVELAGYENIRFIYTPLYEYRLHGENDQYSNRSEQFRGELIVRNKMRLNKAFF